MIGFHSQQTVEKAMKAVLVIHSVPFRRAHGLDRAESLASAERAIAWAQGVLDSAE